MQRIKQRIPSEILYQNQFICTQKNCIDQKQFVDLMLKEGALAFIVKRENQTVAYKLHEKVQAYYAASNSVILSLATFLVHKYPRLPHPEYLDFKLPDTAEQKKFPNSACWFHPMIEPWSDTLSSSVIQGHAVRYQDTLHIIIEVDENYQKFLSKEDFLKKPYSKNSNVREIFQLQGNINQSNKKIAFVNLAVSQTRKDKIQPKVHVLALILGMLYNNEKWNYYPILKGQIPEIKQLEQNDAVILPGSNYSVLNRVPQIVKLMQNLGQAYKKNKKLKILGICFGHQAICDYFKASFIEKERFDGQQNVVFDIEVAQKYSFLKPLVEYGDRAHCLNQYHQGFVQQIPQGFDLLGKSKSCKVEAVVSHDSRIFSIQFHAQYYVDFTEILIKRFMNYTKNGYKPGNYDFPIELQQKFANVHHASCDSIRNSMVLFLQGK